MADLTLFAISNVIHGGVRNYITATVSLYVSISNLFTSLLYVLGFMGVKNDCHHLCPWIEQRSRAMSHARRALVLTSARTQRQTPATWG